MTSEKHETSVASGPTERSSELRDAFAALSERIAAVGDLYAARFGIERDALWYLAKIGEEVGELNGAYLTASGRTRPRASDAADPREKLADEVADVLGFLILFARHEGIDPLEAIERKWLPHLAAGDAGEGSAS